MARLVDPQWITKFQQSAYEGFSKQHNANEKAAASTENGRLTN